MKRIIPYLMSMKDPRDRFTAALLFAIFFLSNGWLWTQYNFSKYQYKQEEKYIKLQEKSAEREIYYLNQKAEESSKRVIEADRKYDSTVRLLRAFVDSAFKKVKK